jgi:hypothetical protein
VLLLLLPETANAPEAGLEKLAGKEGLRDKLVENGFDDDFEFAFTPEPYIRWNVTVSREQQVLTYISCNTYVCILLASKLQTSNQTH